LSGATFTTGGYFLTQDLSGNIVDFVIPHDHVIAAEGDVQLIGDYEGPSLYILAGGAGVGGEWKGKHYHQCD
jgi:hypothetical protein